MLSRRSTRGKDPPPTTPESKMEGWLMKRGEYHRGWKVRWCVLRHNELSYYKSSEATKPISTIPLADAVIRECRDQSEERYSFEVVTRSRVFYLAAKTHCEMVEWIQRMAQFTSLHKENALIEAAEDLVCELARSEADEHERRMRAYLSSRPPTHAVSGRGHVLSDALSMGSPPSALHLSASPAAVSSLSAASHAPRRPSTHPEQRRPEGAATGGPMGTVGTVGDRPSRASFPPEPDADVDAEAVAEFARSLSPAIFTAVGMPPSRGDL
eukprot:TRINITY_DN20680_c0_g1_i1.p1 TRINITY_DN20680_c0_g1~~TRINITY_DN20680_c0_g1_i1.p1  ORF type:complete len:309 (+),score=89.59 TRINITY_DN20680_c0_g1_i1:122-928(+)